MPGRNDSRRRTRPHTTETRENWRQISSCTPSCTSAPLNRFRSQTIHIVSSFGTVFSISDKTRRYVLQARAQYACVPCRRAIVVSFYYITTTTIIVTMTIMTTTTMVIIRVNTLRDLPKRCFVNATHFRCSETKTKHTSRLKRDVPRTRIDKITRYWYIIGTVTFCYAC